jgi:hypothetical protein
VKRLVDDTTKEPAKFNKRYSKEIAWEQSTWASKLQKLVQELYPGIPEVAIREEIWELAQSDTGTVVPPATDVGTDPERFNALSPFSSIAESIGQLPLSRRNTMHGALLPGTNSKPPKHNMPGNGDILPLVKRLGRQV